MNWESRSLGLLLITKLRDVNLYLVGMGTWVAVLQDPMGAWNLCEVRVK